MDDVRAAAERVIRSVEAYVAEHGNGPIGPNLYADALTVARFAVLEAADRQAAQAEDLERLRAALVEVRACLDHLYSDLTYPVPRLPSVLYPFSGPISVMDRVVSAALDAPAAGAGEAVADHLWSGRDDNPPLASIRGVTTCCNLPQSAHPGLTWDSVLLFARPVASGVSDAGDVR